MVAQTAEAEGVDVLLGVVRKNSTEEVRVRRTRYEGQALVDCRVWYGPAGRGVETDEEGADAAARDLGGTGGDSERRFGLIDRRCGMTCRKLLGKQHRGPE